MRSLILSFIAMLGLASAFSPAFAAGFSENRVNDAKQTAVQWVDLNRKAFEDVAIAIHGFAEIGLEEYKSSKALADLMEKNGFPSFQKYEPLNPPPEGEFRLTVGRSAVHTHVSTQNNPYLNELVPENTLWLNTEEAQKLGITKVRITGGEPLIQEETPLLISNLLDKGYRVLLETNGSLDVSMIDRRCVRIIDIKLPI